MKKYSKLMAILLVVAMLLPGIAQAAPAVTKEDVHYVTVIDLNLRTRNDDTASPVVFVPEGEKVLYKGEATANGYFKLEYNGKVGFAHRGDVTSEENYNSDDKTIHDVKLAEKSNGKSYRVVQNISLRTGNGKQYRSVELMVRDGVVKHLGTTENGWFKVNYDGQDGYVYRGDVTGLDNSGSDEIHDIELVEKANNKTYVAIVDLALRTGNGKQYKAIGLVERGQEVTHLGTTANGWFKVDANGTVGYVYRGDLTSRANYDDLHEEEVVEELKVVSVSAINKTTVEVKFNKAVDKAEAANFTIKGGKVISSTLSEDKTVATLDVTGLDYGTEYTIVVKDVVVDAEVAEEMTAKFTTPEVASLWNLEVVPAKGSIEADGTDNTTVTFQLVDKVTGEVDKNANDIVLDLNTTYGSLAQKRTTIQNGVATVVLRSEFNAKGVTAKVEAQIIEASGDYIELIGKVSGSANVVFAAPGSAEVDAVYLTAANTNEADRVTLTFDKAVSVADFVKTDINGKLTGVLRTDNNVKITQDNKEVAIKGFLTGPTKNSLIAILDVVGVNNSAKKSEVLTDNSNVYIAVNMLNTSGQKTESVQDFKFTDARLPQVTSVNAVGMNQLVVKFSEPIAEAQFLIDGKYNEKAFDVNYGKFVFNNETKEFVDNRNVVTLKLNNEYKEVKDLAGYFSAGKHALQVSSIYDFAALSDNNNIGSTQNLEFTVAENKDLAVVDVKVDSPNQYRVTFDKDATLTNAKDNLKLQVYNETTKTWVKAEANNGDLVGTPTLKITPITGDTTIGQYKVEVEEAWTTLYNTASTKNNYYNDKYRIVIAKNALKTDVNGKTNASDIELSLNFNGSAMNNPDTTSPVISKVEETRNEGVYVVTMSEPVQESQAGEIAKSVEFIGKDKDGKVRTFKGVSLEYTNDGLDTKFYVSTGNANYLSIKDLVLDGGSEDWTLVLKDVTDDIGNKAATVTKDFKITAEQLTGKFEVNSVKGTKVEDVETITINFTDDVALTGKGSAIDTANFNLNGTELPTGTSIKLGNTKTVVITVKAGTLRDGSNVLTLGKNLVSKDGKALTGAYAFTFNVNDEGTVIPPVDTAVEEANKLINNLPAAADVELADEANIVAARAAYNALTAEQQAEVNDAKLVAAETKLAELKAEAGIGSATYEQVGNVVMGIRSYKVNLTEIAFEEVSKIIIENENNPTGVEVVIQKDKDGNMRFNISDGAVTSVTLQLTDGTEIVAAIK